MKEEALLEYNDALIDFDYMDYAHPQPPLRFLMNAEIQRIYYAQVKRSTVLWTINALAVDMMRTRYLHHLPFKVTSYSELIYSGFLSLEGDPTTEQPPSKNLSEVAKTLSHPLYLASKPINSTSFSLQSYSKFHDHPVYTIEFVFVPSGTELSAYLMFRTFLALLLQLAKADATTMLPRISIMQPDLQAWVFMRAVQHPQSRYVFQQFHAIALVEAMARYLQLHAKFREMTFRFSADGQLLADGCVVRGVQYRRWCFGLYMGDDAGTADVVSS